MIDLKLERKDFEELSYKNGVRNFTKDDVDGGYFSAELDYNWHIWIKSAESKQAAIDSLKARLANVENDGLDFEQLYLMALKNSKKPKYVLNWIHVSRHGPGATKAVKICKHFGIDPEGIEFRKEAEGG